MGLTKARIERAECAVCRWRSVPTIPSRARVLLLQHNETPAHRELMRAAAALGLLNALDGWKP